jgi:molybdenum-dependent DNA-binding transcriptional regulator ModE
VFTFDQLSPVGVPYDSAYQPLEELMENFDELIQRLLEVQSGGRQRSPKLIAEGERLMDGLRLAARPAQTVELSQIVQSGHD